MKSCIFDKYVEMNGPICSINFNQTIRGHNQEYNCHEVIITIQLLYTETQYLPQYIIPKNKENIGELGPICGRLEHQQISKFSQMYI